MQDVAGGVLLGFLCISEDRKNNNTSDGCYDPSVHLSMKDMSVDDSRHPTLFQIKIKQSKTNLFQMKISSVPSDGIVGLLSGQRE